MTRAGGFGSCGLALWVLATLGAPAAADEGPGVRDPYRSLVVEPERHLDHESGYRPRTFEWHGYVRTRGDFLGNGSLGTLGDARQLGRREDWVESFNLRVRLAPQLHLGREATLHLTVDALDNLVLGSTPDAATRGSLAPAAGASTTQAVPAAGVNDWRDSIQVKKAYLELSIPLGTLLVGRMGNNWGLGMVASAGDELDDDYDDMVDRIGFVTSLFDHLIALSFDFNANGPTTAVHRRGGQPFDLSDSDDVRTVNVAVTRFDTADMSQRRLRAGRSVVNYGLAFSYRFQDMDLPTYIPGTTQGEPPETSELVRRDFRVYLVDAWLRLAFRAGPTTLRLEAEAAYGHGSVDHPDPLSNVHANFRLTSDQGAAVARFEVQPAGLPLWLRLHGGYASGDAAPGFGVWSTTDANGLVVLPRAGDIDGLQIQFYDDARMPRDTQVNNFRLHPNYRIDEILWRRIVGTFTDGWFLRFDLRYYPLPALKLHAGAIYSQTLYAMSAPGLARPLGVELDLGASYFTRGGFEARLRYAVLFPFAGLRDYFRGLEAEPAHLVRLMLAYTL